MERNGACAAAATTAATAAAIAILALGGCARSPERTLEVGPFRLRVVVPAGWEHLDHGRAQIFRQGETRLSLAAIGPEALEGLPTVDPDSTALLLFQRSLGVRRLELARMERRTIHGAEWTILDAWDRDTHSNRTRSAFLEGEGEILALEIDRGTLERAEAAFEALLRTIELIPDEPPPR
ncbi:MAG TPA: hypothetical protein VFU59_07985 [Candidatus Eisenbacteria bacterium]|nr:hypothetical protein [Candidatus Eisenbacteria bacterium]